MAASRFLANGKSSLTLTEDAKLAYGRLLSLPRAVVAPERTLALLVALPGAGASPFGQKRTSHRPHLVFASR